MSVQQRISRLIAVAAVGLALTAGYSPDPVRWSGALVRHEADGTLVYSVRAVIEKGWYVYSMEQPADGPAPLRFRTPANSGATVSNVAAPAPRVSYDRGFKARVGKYYGTQSFSVSVRPGKSTATVPLEVRYQACNDNICLPPRTKPVPISLTAAGR